MDFSEIDPFSETIVIPANYSTSADSTNPTVDDTDITADQL